MWIIASKKYRLIKKILFDLYTSAPRHSNTRCSKTSSMEISAVVRSFRGASICWGCGRGEAVTPTNKLHEIGIHSHCGIHMLMRLRGGVASRRKPRERVKFNQEPCHIRRGLHLLCPPTCRDMAIPFKVCKKK